METDKRIVLSEMSEEEKKLVKNQLEIILESTYFNSAKQMKRFLEYVVERTLAGKGNLLKQYTIGVEALEFPDDFDSDSNPVVRIMAGRVRSRLEEFYNNTEDNEIIITIPKGAYTPQFSYFSSENSSFPQKADIDNDEVYISTGPRLALLGFTDETQRELSNRLLLQTTDALAEQLSRFVTFNLIVYNPFSDKRESHGIGQGIDADYVLALYVQELADEKFELICRLINEGPEEILWSESYELSNKIPIADQVNVLGKITAVIADTHQGRLHTHWARNLLLNKENIPQKFKAVAYYRQYYDNFNIETFEEAVSVCEVAISQNTNDILANILFSDLCRRDYVHSYDLIESSLSRGITCAERVAHLRQDSSAAHYTLGQLLFCQGEWGRSEEEFKVARNTSHTHGVIEYGSGYHLCLMGRWDEGLSLVNKAIELSEAYPSWYRMPLFLSLYTQGKYQEALLEAEKIVVPSMPYGPLARCISYAQLGKIEKAKEQLSEILIRIPDIKKNGKNKLLRLFGNEELTRKIWNGLEIAING